MLISNHAVRLAAAAFFASCLLASSSSATTVTLSDASSDEVGFPAATMDGTVEFTVSGNTLTLDVTNDTTGTVRMTEVVFNGSLDVTNLTLDTAPNASGGAALWVFSTSATADVFGTFDYGLEGIKVGNGPSAEFGEVLAGETIQFTFTISGSGFDASSFSSSESSAGFSVAAFFATNGGNGGAYGAAVVPEPSSAVLLMLGLIGLTQLGRRRN